MQKIKIQSILTAVAGLFLATSCSSSFLDTEPTDAVSSDQVAVAGNAERLFNGAWYNLFEYGTTYANIGYRALQCQDDMMASDPVRNMGSILPISLMMWRFLPMEELRLPGI